MATPSTPSSAASPHPPVASTPGGAAAPSSSLASNVGSTTTSGPQPPNRDFSFLEPIPVLWQELIPLEWAIPLTPPPQRNPASTDSGDKLSNSSQLASTVTQKSAAISNQWEKESKAPFVASLGSPSLQSSTPRVASSENKPFTPASGLGLGSPAVPQSLSSATSSISQAQTPWRVRWACFRESQVSSASSGPPSTPTGLAPAKRAHPHSQSGSLSPSLGVLENGLRGQGFSASPFSLLNDKGNGKARSTPLDHSAQHSSSTSQRAKKRPKYFHRDLPTASRPPYAAHPSIQALFGPNNHSAMEDITRLLQNCEMSSTCDPFEMGKRYFLQKDAPSKHLSSSGTEPALPMKEGRLPRRLAYITGQDNGVPGIEASPSPGNSRKSTRLYLFYLSQPDTFGTIGDGEVDPFELDTELLELDFSGTFTPSDIFPSLYNDNGLYIPPTSLHPATKQSSSSATMMANSHLGAASKAPFSLSSLSIASSSNKEAVAASEVFIKAVEDLMLANVADMLTAPGSACAEPLDDTAQNASYGPSLRKNAAAVKCGDCLYVPATCNALQTTSRRCHSANVNGAHSSRRSTFIRCQSYYTAAGLRTSLRTTPTELELLTRPSSAIRHRSSNASSFRKVDYSVQQGETVTLCPLALPAVFSRWFGCHQNGVSFKQVAAEQDRLPSAREDFEAQFGVSMDCNSSALGDDWFLCRFGEGAQILWPASLALRSPRHTWKGDTKTSDIVRSQMPMRLRIAIAKSSSKAVHKLLFQTRNSRSKTLASWTGRHIERQSAERESSKHKGDVPAHDAASSHPVSTPSSIAPSKSKEVLSNFQDATATLKPSYAAVGLDEDEFDAEPEQPTWESVSRKLTRVTGVKSFQKSSPAVPTAELQDATAAQSYDSVILAEPQRPSIHRDQSTLAPGRDTANAQASRKSIADIFRDFSWDYPAQTEQDSVTQVNSGRNSGAYGNFTDETIPGYGLFETTGLTDDDFSFFDSPDAAQTFQHTRANITTTQSNTLPGALAVTADDLASIVGSSGPIDHFGHLMPKTMKTPGTVANLDNGSLSEQPLSPAQHFDTPATLRSSAISLELPSLEQSGLFHARDSIMSVDKALTSRNGPGLETAASSVRCQSEHAYGDVVPRDRKTIVKLSSSRSSEQAPGAAVTVAFETGLAIYRPLPFFLPSPPSSDSDDASLGNGVATTNVTERLIGQTRAHRAARVRSALSHVGQQGTKAHSSNNRSWIPRNKRLDRGGALSSLESSDSDSEDLPAKPASREAQPSDTLDDIVSGQLLHVAKDISRYVAATEADENQADPITANASKVSRGEREAVTTIFMQHMAENIDFRERNYQAYPSRPSVNSAFVLRPTSGLSLAQHLVPAPPTKISLYYHEAIMQMSITSLRFWTRLGLSPLSRPKNTQAVLLAASSLVDDATKECLSGWLDCIGELWQKCGFGKHTGGSAEDAIFTLECSKLSECRKLQEGLAEISPALIQRIAGEHTCIIYVVVADDECYQPTSTLVYLCGRLHLLRKGVLPHIVPLSLLAAEMQTLSLREGGSLHESVFLRFVFDVFDRLPINVTRMGKDKLPPSKTKPGQTMPPAAVQASRAFMAPAFKLVPQRSAQIQFALQWPPPALSVMDSHRLLHVGYHLSDDRKWLLLAAIDDHGEHHSTRARFVDGADVTHLTRRVWAFAKEFWEFASVEWRICISRMDSMPVPELQAWCDTMHASIPGLSRPSMVSILTYSRSCSMATPAISHKDGGPSRRPSIALPTLPESKHAQGQYPIFTSTTIHPSAVFTDLPKNTCVGTPKGTVPLYYSLARATVFAPAAVASHDPEMIAACAPVGTSSAYTIDLLAVTTHTLSSYNRPLSEHISDVAQSSIDLYTLARERWSFTSAFYMRGEAGPLPWHLAILNGMASYDFDSLLPT